MHDNEINTELIKRLTAYAQSLIEVNSWFRGKDALPKGYTAGDFATETIIMYLENKEKFDPKRNSNLLKYLKYNILRRLIYNLATSAENENSLDLEDTGEDDENCKAFEDQLPFAKLAFDEKIDVEALVEKIESGIKGDSELEEIFLFLYYGESKRSEICEDLNISTAEYDNRLKRLKTLVKKIIKKFKE